MKQYLPPDPTHPAPLTEAQIGGMAQCDSVSATGRRCGLAPQHAPFLHMNGADVYYWEDDGEEQAGAAMAMQSQAERLKETEARCEALRKLAIERVVCRDGSNMRICSACGTMWKPETESERHNGDCPVRPLGESNG